MNEQPETQIKEAVSFLKEGFYAKAESILLSIKQNKEWEKDVVFLLGRLYKEKGSFEEALSYLKKSSESYPLMRDYALYLLAELYMPEGRFSEALKTIQLIKSSVLQQRAKSLEIEALLSANDEITAVHRLRQYVISYPLDWAAKMQLAVLLKGMGEKTEAIRTLKELYIKATPFSDDAYLELKEFGAERLTRREMIKRATYLYRNNDFKQAEMSFKKILDITDDLKTEKSIRFSLSKCQFYLKRYEDAILNFGMVGTDEAMYWMARSLYRAQGINEFEKSVKQFKKDFPRSKYLPDLLLILAEGKRRNGGLAGAESIYKEVAQKFPSKKKEALWGLGWMYYMDGRYRDAWSVFSSLSSSYRDDNERYLYWKARSIERSLKKKCIQKSAKIRDGEDCVKAYSILEQISGYKGYYNFLAGIRLGKLDNVELEPIIISSIPDGEIYRRIEKLKLFGMRDEAILEIQSALKYNLKLENLKYLAVSAFEFGEYNTVLPYTETLDDAETLPLSYPLGFWDVVKEVSKKEGIDPYIVLALIREESRFDPDALSRAGAIGVMQLMPFTAHRVKNDADIRLDNDSEIFDPRKNISIGVSYFSSLFREFGSLPLAVAAYNAGENAVRRWLKVRGEKDMDEFIEDIPYTETRNYVKRVMRSYWQYRRLNGLPVEGY
jgi:soluble lytic murein transglycosylase